MFLFKSEALTHAPHMLQEIVCATQFVFISSYVELFEAGLSHIMIVWQMYIMCVPFIFHSNGGVFVALRIWSMTECWRRFCYNHHHFPYNMFALVQCDSQSFWEKSARLISAWEACPSQVDLNFSLPLLELLKETTKLGPQEKAVIFCCCQSDVYNSTWHCHIAESYIHGPCIVSSVL